MSARLNKKLAQTAASDAAFIPAYVAIVEFGSPQTRFVKKRTGRSAP